jgi:hypothetical protein
MAPGSSEMTWEPHEFKAAENGRFPLSCQYCGRVRDHPHHTNREDPDESTPPTEGAG